MAHFAKLGIGNVVEKVETVSNDIKQEMFGNKHLIILLVENIH